VTFNHAYTDGPRLYTIKLTATTTSGSCGNYGSATLYEIGLWRGLNDDQQQAHPNARGQEAIARVVAAFINTHL
jgi:hypothetical protein